MLETPSARNNQVKEYIDTLFASEDEVLKNTRKNCKEAGLSDIHIPAHLGKFLYLLAKIQSCSRILELGTLGGYSTIWLARALLPGGLLVSIEIDPKHGAIAKKNIEEAGLANSVDIRLGNALTLLPEMIDRKERPFDLIFIDADKENNCLHLDHSIQLARPGTLIFIDNLIPRGEQVGGRPANHEAQFIYAFNSYLAQHPRLETVLIPSIVQYQGRLDCIGLARLKD